MLTPSLLLALWAGLCSAPVYVDAGGLEGPAELRGWLLWRLVGAGHPVVPRAEAASIQITLRGGAGAGVEIVAEGGEVRRHRIPPGDAEVVRLEILQHAVLLLDALPPRMPTVAETPLALELVPADQPATAELMGSLVAALLDRGLSIVPRAESQRTQRLCILSDHDQVRLRCGQQGPGCNPTTEVLVSPRHLAESAAALLEAAAIEEATPPPPEPSIAARPGTAPIGGPAPASWFVSAGLGGLVRQEAIDPLTRLTAGLGRPAGPVLLLAAGFTPSHARLVTIREGALLAGAGWRLRWAGALTLSVALLGGAWLQSFQVEPFEAWVDGELRTIRGDSGVLASGTLELPIELSWALHHGWGLRLTALAGHTLPERNHLAGGDLLWGRSASRLGIIAGVEWTSP